MDLIDKTIKVTLHPSTPLTLTGAGIGYFFEGALGAIVVGTGVLACSIIYHSAVLLSRNYDYK